MDKALLDLHSLLRWVILALLILSIVKAYTGWHNQRAFTPADRRVWLFTLIASHITLLIGLYQWLWGRYGFLKITVPQGESVMTNSFFRFFWVEHPLFMLLAVALITLGNGMAKKNLPDTAKFKRAFWLFVVALLMILVAIPWPFRASGIGRSLLPGMS